MTKKALLLGAGLENSLLAAANKPNSAFQSNIDTVQQQSKLNSYFKIALLRRKLTRAQLKGQNTLTLTSSQPNPPPPASSGMK